MAPITARVTSQALGAEEYAGRSLGYIWNPSTLAYEVATAASAGGGGAATIVDGGDVAQGATTDAESAAGNGTVVAILKRIRTLLSNPLAVTGTFFQATQPVSGTFFQATQPVSGTFFQATQPVSLATNTPDVTDRAGRLLGIIASITAAIDVSDRAARVLGRAQVLDSASALIDPALKSQLPAALVGGRLDVNVGANVAQDITDRVARLLGSVQERENGYANVSLFAEAVAGIIAETAITISKSVQYAAATTATSQGATAGKELVICGIIIGWVSTSTTANTCRLRIRVNPGGAAIITSPIAFTMRIGWESATFIANEEELQPIFFDKPIIIPNGGQFMATLACVAANATLDLQLIAYERTP